MGSGELWRLSGHGGTFLASFLSRSSFVSVRKNFQEIGNRIRRVVSSESSHRTLPKYTKEKVMLERHKKSILLSLGKGVIILLRLLLKLEV